MFIQKLIDKVDVRRHSLIFDEADILVVLKAIDKKHDLGWRFGNMSIGNCGWSDKTKWYIEFSASTERWNNIVQDLNVKRVWKNADILDKTTGVYSTD